MTTAYSITALGKKDIPALLQLEEECFSSAWDARQYGMFLISEAGAASVQEALAAQTGKNSCGFVFGAWQSNTTLLGYLSCLVHYPLREIEIFNFAVQQQQRRQGIGRLLMQALVDGARQLLFEQIILEVREHNTPALNLYTSFSFAVCGRRKQYYADTGEDALLLSLALCSSP